ncbi:MAG: GNAT family N-acetyltransferase [Sphingomonas sp.]
MNDPDLQPTLSGEHVVLRPIAAGDWEEMFAAAADPLIWAVHPAPDRYTEPVFRQYFDGALASGAAFAILDRETGRIIGTSRYHGYDAALGEIEIGWTFLARDYWGGAFNRQIKTLMLDHAFGFAETVIFMVGEDNFRSQRAMEKIGGVRRPELLDRAYRDVVVRHVVFEIRKGG